MVKSLRGNRGDDQSHVVDGHLANLDVNATRHGDPRDPILGVLGQRTADEPLVVHAMDDQATLRHRHRGDRVADIGGNPPLEIELGVLNAPEQLPECVLGEGTGHFAELWNRRHLPPTL